MALEADILKRVAHLARLELTESEAASLRTEVSSCWSTWICSRSLQLLSELLAQPNIQCSLREDKPVDGNGQELLKLSPDSKDRFVRVPRVLPS